MVLKDIKNEPDVSAGLHPPLSLLKRRMSDTGYKSSLPPKSKIRRGSLQKGLNDSLTSTKREQITMNVCSDLANDLQSGSLTLQNKKGSKSGYCKVESIKQGGLKSSDGMLLTVTPAEELPHDVHSSECHSASTLLDISNMSTSFFADPTTDLKYEAPGMTEVTSNNSNKYFSTPMVSKRVKKKLTPVMELEVESYATNEWRSPHKIATLDTIHKHLNAGILHESPAQDLLYRSFFATECQEIVNQLEGIETIVKSPAKRKADVLDVSTIDAEPPPYDSSPMKSMLACEVANMMRSLDNSPVKEGVSFGESLLDLENIDMQLHDFDLSECSKGKSLNDCSVEGIINLGADLSGCCSMKRQKTEQVANNKNKPNSRTPMKGLLANTVDNRTKQQSNGDLTNNSDINTKQHTRCNSEEVASGDTTQVIKTDITDHADFIQDEVLSLNASQFEDPTKDLVNTTQNIVNETSSDELHNANTTHVIQAELTSPVNITPDTPQMHKITTRNNPQVMEFLPQTSIIPQDIPSVSESSLANNTQVIELVSQSFANITQDISPIHDETTSQMTEVGPQSFTNTTQVIPTMRKVVATANTSMVTHIGLKPSGNSTQDILPVHEEDLASNTTQVIEEPQISANTTQDISPIRDMAAPINTTQLKEPGPQTSANITLDITSICNLENAANTSQETEVGPQFSANTTQDIVVMHSFDNAASTTHLPEVGIQSSVNTTQNVNAANTTQVTDVGLQSAANTTQDITPIHNLVNASNTTPATDVVPQSSANTTQDIVVMHGFDNAANTTHSPEVGLQSSMNTTQNVNAANTTQVTDVGLQSSANTPLGRTLIHNSVNTSNTTQATEVVLQSSANTTQDVASIHNLVCATNNITQETVLSSQYSASSTQDITLHKVSIDSSVQTMEVVPHLLSNNTLITSLKDEVNTSNTTDNIKIPSETLTKKTPDIPSADEVLKTHHSMQSISPDVKKIETVSTSPQAINAVQKNIPDVTKDLTSPPEVPVTNSPLVQGVPQNSSNAADHQNSEDFKLNTDASEDRQLNISLNEVSQKASTVSLNDLNPVLISKETIQQSVEGQKQLEDIVCDVDNGTIGQRKLNVTGVEKSKATEKKCNKNPLEKNEMYSFKESNDPLLLESCSMIHEEENAHDVSVFSAGSLSFVTSTPVPGFNNFQFQKTYRDSVQQDPNMSIGSLSEEPTNKVVVDQTVASQKKLVLNGNDKLKQIPRTSMLPPSTIDRGIRPPSGLMPRQIPSSSAIPSARRSLALANNPTSQTSAKEPMFSKTLPKGIPGRGSIRPPMVRQSLPRVSLGGMKQSTEGTGCNVTANKLKGSTFRTPKPAAAKLPTAPSIVKPPSRLSAPNSTRLTVGAQNVTSSLQDAACGETATGMRPPTAADVRTGLPKPVSSSIRPPQLHSQKVSPKLKSSLPGLAARKTIPALGPRKDIASSKGAIMSAKSSIKLNTSSAANEAVSFQAAVKSSSSPCRNENTTAENLKLQTSISPLEKCPDTSTDESEKCLHQETCKCCHLRYQQLLQELEELKKCHTCKGKE